MYECYSSKYIIELDQQQEQKPTLCITEKLKGIFNNKYLFLRNGFIPSLF